MKHCTDDDLIDYLHGELGDGEDARIHAHLAVCDACTSRYDAEAAVGDSLRASARAEEREFPALIRAHVWAAIGNAEPTLLERLRAFISPIAAIPLAAAFALLMYFGVPILRGAQATGTPTVSAAYYLDEHAAQGQENPLADRLAVNSSLAAAPTGELANSPLIEAADAATLDDLVASRQ